MIYIKGKAMSVFTKIPLLEKQDSDRLKCLALFFDIYFILLFSTLVISLLEHILLISLFVFSTSNTKAVNYETFSNKSIFGES